MKRQDNIIRDVFKSEEGFSLLEILLSVAIIGFIALSFVQISQDYIHNKRAVVAAEHMKMIHKAAYSYLMNNFDDIYSTHLGGELGAGSTFLIPVEDDGSPHYLKRDPDLLPASFNARSPFGQTVVVLLRNAGNRNVEIVCMSTGRPVAEKQVETAALSLGGYGGFWSAVNRDSSGGTTVNNVIGGYGMWSVPVASLTTPSWPASDFPTLDEGAYLASYQWINYPNEIGDYLYRIALPLAPEANRMMTAINMNTYNIDGVDDISLNGNLDVANFARLEGSAAITGNTTIGALAGAGDLIIASPGNQAYIEQISTVAGSLDVENRINANDFIRDSTGVDPDDINSVVVGTTVTVNDSVSDIGTINAENTEATGLVMNNADMLAVTLDFSNTSPTSGQINVGSGTIESNVINGGTITTSGFMEAETLSGDGQTVISGPIGDPSNNTTTILQDSVMNGQVRIGGGGVQGRFRCDIGC